MPESLFLGRTPLLVNATTGVGTPVYLNGLTREATIYVLFSAGTTQGTIVFETATHADYTGAWAQLGSPVAFEGTAPNQRVVRISGPLVWLRARFTVGADQPVSAYLWAN